MQPNIGVEHGYLGGTWIVFEESAPLCHEHLFFLSLYESNSELVRIHTLWFVLWSTSITSTRVKLVDEELSGRLFSLTLEVVRVVRSISGTAATHLVVAGDKRVGSTESLILQIKSTKTWFTLHIRTYTQ